VVEEGAGVSSLDGRVAAVRRLEGTAVGSPSLRRLAELVVRLLDASAARISLLGDAETVVSGAGLAPGLIGGQTPLDRSLAAVVDDHPLVVGDAAQERRTCRSSRRAGSAPASGCRWPGSTAALSARWW
jgi:hypothetical protein